jgi:DNA-binding response OmpR family regulator
MRIEMPRLALIVDDDEGDLKDVIKRAKNKYGITLKHCTNLEDAKDTFEKSGGERTFVGIILDFNGKVLLRQLN